MSERESVITAPSAMPRSAAAWRAAARTECRQPGAIGLAAQHELVCTLVGEDVLAEARHQLGEPLHDRRVTLLCGRSEPGAGADEVEVEALEDTPLLVVEPRLLAACVQRVDVREQPGMVVDPAVVAGELRRHLSLHGLQRRRSFARRQVVEQRADAGEVATGSVERGDRVLEGRRFGAGDDRVDLVAVLAHRLGERGCEVLGAHLAERRQAERPGPGNQQWIRHFLRWMSLRSRSS